MSEQPTFEETADVVSQQDCPICGAAAPALTLERRMTPKPLGSYSLAGAGMKLSVIVEWVASCAHCPARFKVGDVEYLD